MKQNIIYNIDCLTGLKQLPDACVQTCVTSPPYYGLRDYGNDGQIGLEETPEAFVQKLVEVFREVKRVLRDDGTLWLNLGDSYAGSGKGGQSDEKRSNGWQPEYGNKGKKYGLKPKDLIGIPWMVAFALRADGWYLRQDIIWNKPNPMPESVTDRCTKSHEYIFLLSKSQKYYYNHEAIMEACVWDTGGLTEKRVDRANDTHKAMPTQLKNGIRPKKKGTQTFGGKKAINDHIDENDPRFRNGHEQLGRKWTPENPTRNKRSVWTVTTKPYKEAHFATYPEKLIEPCIKAGSPEGGVVLDPFMGAGTTALTARKLNRNYIGFELNDEYIKIAEKRITTTLGLFI